jgi:dipeptidase E
VAEFYRVFAGRARCSHLSLFQRGAGDLRELLLDQDVLYIGGGNTANLLAVWRVHGVDAIVWEAWEAGVVIVGVSAGACALFEAGVSASFGTVAPLMDGIGLVRGAFCPHYEERRATLLEMLGNGLPLGFGADSGAALHFVEGELAGAIGVTPDQRAFRVEPGPIETPLPVRRAP